MDQLKQMKKLHNPHQASSWQCNFALKHEMENYMSVFFVLTDNFIMTIMTTTIIIIIIILKMLWGGISKRKKWPKEMAKT